jgi:hypothetical protein
VGIVRKRLWHHITAEQEERAREVIARSRARADRNETPAAREAIARLVGEVSRGLTLEKPSKADAAGQSPMPTIPLDGKLPASGYFARRA